VLTPTQEYGKDMSITQDTAHAVVTLKLLEPDCRVFLSLAFSSIAAQMAGLVLLAGLLRENNAIKDCRGSHLPGSTTPGCTWERRFPAGIYKRLV